MTTKRVIIRDHIGGDLAPFAGTSVDFLGYVYANANANDPETEIIGIVVALPTSDGIDIVETLLPHDCYVLDLYIE